MGEEVEKLCKKVVNVYNSRCIDASGKYDPTVLDSSLEMLEAHRELEPVIAARLGLISLDIMVRIWHRVPDGIDELKKQADEERKKLEGKEKPEYADSFACYGLVQMKGKVSREDIYRLKEEFLARFK